MEVWWERMRWTPGARPKNHLTEIDGLPSVGGLVNISLVGPLAHKRSEQSAGSVSHFKGRMSCIIHVR